MKKDPPLLIVVREDVVVVADATRLELMAYSEETMAEMDEMTLRK